MSSQSEPLQVFRFRVLVWSSSRLDRVLRVKIVGFFFLVLIAPNPHVTAQTLQLQYGQDGRNWISALLIPSVRFWLPSPCVARDVVAHCMLGELGNRLRGALFVFVQHAWVYGKTCPMLPVGRRGEATGSCLPF